MSGPKTIKPPSKALAPTNPSQSVSCETIREAAYSKWEAAGCPCGDGVDFWLQAEAELTDETTPESRASET